MAIAAVIYICTLLNWPIFGPCTRVMIIAPATVARVPAILAWLRMLINFTLSSLKSHAMMNVMAGRTFAIAAANVAVVYFIPKK